MSYRYGCDITELEILVQVRRWGVWVTIKKFRNDDDPEFAELQAEELFETLIEK